MIILKATIIGVASVALALFVFAEVLLAMPVAWWFYLLLIPLFAFGILCRQSVSVQVGRLAAFAAVVAVIAALYFVPWSSRKPFLHDLYSIHPGMTEADVRRIMSRYIEGTGWPAPYGVIPAGTGTLTDLGTGATHPTGTTSTGEITIKSSLVFRHSTAATFDSDWGIVTLKSGRVTGVSFSPD